MVTNILSRWVKMFFLMGTMEVRKSLRRMKKKHQGGVRRHEKKKDDHEIRRAGNT